jgi:hypothetical protein
MQELAKQRDADSKTTRDLTEQIKQLKNDIGDHQKERKRLHEANLSLNNHLKEAVKKISALGVEVGKLKSTTERDQKRIAELKSRMSKYRSKMTQIKDELTKAKASLKLVSGKHGEALKYVQHLKHERDMALRRARCELCRRGEENPPPLALLAGSVINLELVFCKEGFFLRGASNFFFVYLFCQFLCGKGTKGSHSCQANLRIFQNEVQWSRKKIEKMQPKKSEKFNYRKLSPTTSSSSESSLFVPKN